MKDKKSHDSNDRSNDDERQKSKKAPLESPNPPRTTTGKLTAPKFGSAVSGGGDLEPGPEKS